MSLTKYTIIIFAVFEKKSFFSEYLSLLKSNFKVKSAVPLASQLKFQFIVFATLEEFNNFLAKNNPVPGKWKIVEYRIFDM